MLAYFEQFVNSLKRPKILLVFANILLVFFLILLSNLGVLPMKGVGDFVFFTILAFAFALYRPGWGFLFFVGTVALENINLAPVSLGIAVRPYQLIGGLSIVAVLLRAVTHKLNFALPKWHWLDILPVVLGVAGLISALGSAPALKQAVIMLSFVALYFLVRIFIQNLDDLKRVIPFFLGSAGVVVLYGIWQNVRFMQGLSHFEVMPGRPNATLAEADWLGIYLVLVLAVIYSILYGCHFERSEAKSRNLIYDDTRRSLDRLGMTLLYLFLTSCFVLLILTVSRSAWLGALAVSILYLAFCIWHVGFKNENWRGFFQQLIFLAIAIFFSFAAVYAFKLTTFQLFNRVQSTGTGLQKITIVCQPYDWVCEIPKVITSNSDFEKCACRHINLEEIESEIRGGNVIKEVYRQDPNINIRKEIYQKSWTEIKKHPLVGIGWGNIGAILGTDERGTGLNSSNIFLEVWLGAGLVGIVAFVMFLGYWLSRALKYCLRREDWKQGALGLFLLLSLVALIVPNLFNAGIFLGIVWLFLGIVNLTPE